MRRTGSEPRDFDRRVCRTIPQVACGKMVMIGLLGGLLTFAQNPGVVQRKAQVGNSPATIEDNFSRLYGAKGNTAVFYDSSAPAGYTFAQVCAAAMAAGKALGITRKWASVPSQACAASAVQFFDGSDADVQPSSGATVTFTGPVISPPLRIFDTSLGGTISIMSNRQFSVYPEWWGSLGPACTAAGKTASLVITGAWSKVTTQALNCQVIFTRGGTIQPGPGQVVTFASFPVCPSSQQCFDTSVGGPGSVLFLTTSPVNFSQAEWFGAAPESVMGTNNGAANSAALEAAQRALPQWPGQTPQGLHMNVGKVQLATSGVNSTGYPLSRTFSLSPHVTLSGVATGATLAYAPSGGFTGRYMFDVINENGSGQPPNSNFSTGLTDLLIDTAQHNTSVIGGLTWGVSLHSHLDQLTVYTRGVGYYITAMDGSGGRFLQADIYNVTCSDTRLTGQGMVFASNPYVTLTNTFENLKFAYFGAYGKDPALKCSGPVGYIPGANPALQIGSISGLRIEGINFENLPYPVAIHAGAGNVRLTDLEEFLDCGTGCAQNFACANTISANAANIFLSGYANHFKQAVCIGEPWQASTAYKTGATTITIIDPNGNIQQLAGDGTSGSTTPVWSSMTGETTVDGTVRWTNQGPLSAACKPSQEIEGSPLSPGIDRNCYIPTISLPKGSAPGLFHVMSGPAGSSSAADNARYYFVYDSNTFWDSPSLNQVTLRSGNFNTTVDQAVVVNVPAGYSRFIVTRVTLSNSSIPLSAATGGIYSRSGKSGCAIVPATQKWTSPPAGFRSSSIVTVGTDTPRGGAPCLNDRNTGSSAASAAQSGVGTIYFSLTTPQGVPATGDLTFNLTFLP